MYLGLVSLGVLEFGFNRISIDGMDLQVHMQHGGLMQMQTLQKSIILNNMGMRKVFRLQVGHGGILINHSLKKQLI